MMFSPGKWKGRIAGSLFGILAGPFGVTFGFLVGYLVDSIFLSGGIRKKVQEFLASPEEAPLAGGNEGLYSFFCLGVAVCIASGGNPERMEEGLLRRSAEYYPLGRRETEYLKSILGVMNSFEPFPSVAAHARELRRLLEARGDEELRSDVSLQKKLHDLYAGLLGFAHGVSVPAGSPADLVLTLLAQIWDIQTLHSEGASTEDDPWRILGLSPGAGEAEVKKVFRMLASQFHPDGFSAFSELQRRETEEAFRRIREAYERVQEGYSK
ncbi:MAG: J domain-containing protein [Spirochaetaceae bacterium]|nr:J domain-containing protein [Spirochaetaceae bacterium]